MPSSLNQNLDKELAARGGVTRGLGPFLRHAYGESDLRGELAERFTSALGEERWADAIVVLQLDASAGGVLPNRTMNQGVPTPSLAPWLVRAVSQHHHGDTLLESMASRPEACSAFVGLVGRRAKAAHEHLADMSDPERIAFGAPLGEILVPPRPTERAKPRSDRKIGRNDPCPCGSGKKFKKCHANDPDFLASLEASDLDDAPGLPGISASEVFWFRHASEVSLAELCKRRLETGGPRAGETLFWPVDESPHDETVVRAEIAAVERPEELPELLSRGLETKALTEQQALDQVAAAYPAEGWFDKPPLPLFKRLTALAASRLVVAGTITAAQVLLLATDEAIRDEWMQTALAATGEGDLAPLVALARALAQAGRASEAYLLTHHCRGAGHPLSLAQVQRLRALDGALATGLGNTPLSEADWLRRDDRAAELAALRSEVKRSKADLEELQALLEQSEKLRKRAEEAWAAQDRGAGGDDQLRREVKRLKGLLTQEHDKRRDVERNLETMRRRERARLLKESSIDHQREELAAEIAEAKVEEKAPAKARHVSYHPDFETVAQRLPPSTVARLRGQIEDLASGRWVREAKRMEGVGNLWTLRAGIHYRALIREYDDHLDVFALIPREELDTTLARLRS